MANQVIKNYELRIKNEINLRKSAISVRHLFIKLKVKLNENTISNIAYNTYWQ